MRLNYQQHKIEDKGEGIMKIRPLNGIVCKKIWDLEECIHKAKLDSLEAILYAEETSAREKGLDMTDFSSWSSYPQCWTSWAKTQTHFSQYESNDGGNRYETHYSTEIVYGKVRNYCELVDLSLVPSPEADLFSAQLEEYKASEEYKTHLAEQKLIEDHQFGDWISDVWNRYNSSRDENTRKLNKKHFPLELSHREESLHYHCIKETQVGCRWWVKDSENSEWRVLEKKTLEWAIIGEYFYSVQNKDAKENRQGKAPESAGTLGSIFGDVFAQFK